MVVNLEILDERLTQIVDVDAGLEIIEAGFRFLEGPAWHPYENYLIFSDIPGNGIYCWDQDRGVSLFRENSHMANGNTFDHQGNLLTCEHATSRVSRTNADNDYQVLVSHYKGKELNSPNDIIVKSDGMIYFSDPNPGRKSPRVAVPREQELPFQGVYMLHPEDESLTLLVDDFSKPNGLCFSMDEKRIFINDTDHQHIRVFDIDDDGNLTNGRVWANLLGVDKDPGVADGMKIDSAGNLYCAGPGGIHVFDENSDCLGRILTPEVAANFTWGDKDLRSLYITATTSLYRLPVKIPGISL